MPLQKGKPFVLKPPGRNLFEPLTLLLLIAIPVLSMACAGAGGSGLHVKSSATGEKDITVKSGYAFALTKSFTDLAGKITTAASYRVYAANYDLDAKNFAMTLDKALTSDDQVRIVFSLVADEGGNEKTPLKTGTYSARADKFMKVEDVATVTRKAGRIIRCGSNAAH